MSPSATLERAKAEQEARIIYGKDDAADPDSPAYQCASYKEQLPDVELMRKTFGGTKTMRAAGKEFLPQHPMEKDEKYKVRVSIATSPNPVRKTIEGLSGMIFRRDPTVSDDMPEQIQQQLENIDLRDNKLAVFLRGASDNALRDGHTWIHVESPRTDGLRTEAEADAAGVRPYWINVKKAQAHNIRWAIRNGKPVLTLFAYRETHVASVGMFGEEIRQRIRVLREGALDPKTGTRGPVLGELWELQEVTRGEKKTNEWVRIEQYNVGVSTVPVVFVPSEKSGTFESRPPLLDLAYEQIEHFRVRSDRQKSLTFSSIAVPYCFGQQVTDQEGVSQVTWGADGMMLLNDPQAKAGIIESQGFGLTATKEELEAIEENFATLGLRMLQRQPGIQPTTATGDILSKSESNASLATFATALEDATNRALQLTAEYQTRIETPGTVTVNRSFHEQLMSPQMIQVLGEQVGAGRLSLDSLWAILVEGEVLNEDFDRVVERARIAKDGAAGLMDLFDTEGGGGEDGVEDEGGA